MKKFKAGRIPKLVWILAILLSSGLGYIFYLALSALLWSPAPKVVNAVIGLLVTSGLVIVIWTVIIKRGLNETIQPKVKTIVPLPLPLVVENSVAKLLAVGIFCLLMGGLVCVMGFVSDERSIWLVLLGFFILMLGLFVVIQRLKAAGQIILRIDEVEGITYSPTVFLKQRVTGPIPWSDITAIDIKTVSAGRSRQSYFQVQVPDPSLYQTGTAKGRKPNRLAQFGLNLTNDANSVILAPLTMLKIKADVLLVTCLQEQAKHQSDQVITQEISETTTQAAIETAELESALPIIGDSAIQVSPFETSAESLETRKRHKKLANALTVMIVVVLTIFSGVAYLTTQNKYAGLKNKTQYILTTDQAHPDMLLSFKIFSDARNQYPVVLFATKVVDNLSINERYVADLVKLQDQVIQKDKIYNLQHEGATVASYSKFKVEKGSLILDLDNGVANMVLGNATFMRLMDIKSNSQSDYQTARIQFSEDEPSETVRIYTVDKLKKSQLLE